MFTYLVINSIFLTAALGVYALRPFQITRMWWAALATLLAMTAVFDSLLIYFDFVAYDETKLLGLYIWLAPVEDFFYSIVAAIIVPTLWNKKGTHASNN